MNPKDIFGLAVRLLGLYFFYLAIASLPMIFSGHSSGLSNRVILNVALLIGFAWWMLGGAPLLVQRAYPTERSQAPSTEVDSEVDSKVDL